MFRMLDSALKVSPVSLNVDFELTVFNAAKSVWPKILKFGCFFHISQSILKFLQRTPGLIQEYRKSPAFRKNYRMLQALAYLPEKEVVEGFEVLQLNCESSFNAVLIYFHRTYIGNLKQNSRSIRDARYPINTWNLHERCKLRMARTNNNIESWHAKLNHSATKNLTLFKLINLLRNEQSKVDTILVTLNMDVIKKRTTKADKKDENLQNLCLNYVKGDYLKFLSHSSLNFRLDKLLLKEVEGEELE